MDERQSWSISILNELNYNFDVLKFLDLKISWSPGGKTEF